VKRKLFIALIFILVLINISPIKAEEVSLSIQSEAVILIEESTGKVLFEKNAYQKMYPASTTKILTALIALENLDANKIIKIGNEVYSVPLDASKAGHIPGDEITLKDLLISLLLPSGNDSAFVIATEVAKKTTGNDTLDFNSAITEFAILMNERAKEIKVTNTNFVNPHGYHDENHYTTAYELALITREALKNPEFKEIIKMPLSTIGSEGAQNQRTLTFRNRNLLLDSRDNNTYYPYATGGKTGFTDEAGECLVATATKDGMNLIAVILKSPKDTRWNETKALFDYGFESFKFHKVVDKGEIVSIVDVEKASPKGPAQLEVISKDEYTDLFHKNDISKIKENITLNTETLIAPIVQGETVGEVTFTLGGEELSKIKLDAKYDIEKRTIWDVMISIEAIPYWSGIIGGIIILCGVMNMLKKRKRKKGFHLR